ncbi:MAG: TrkH family potassium uptake protein [Bacteroidales bacterium]|nr:TrkH family potassium uptake protein [Bacteroidales bacterium]
MNLKVISRNVGLALLVSALFMLLSVFVSMAHGNDSALAALLISFAITFTVGIFPFIFVRKVPAISLKDGYMIVFLSWILSFIFGMLPYALWGGPFSVANAWFESVSGFTTTGATILEDIEALPPSLLFWRSSTHFIGGLGVVVFLLLIIPSSSPVKFRLTSMELSSLSKEGYKTRSNRIIFIFASVYICIFIASFFSYLIAGMGPFDAVNHAFSVSATGGFSTRNLSIGYFDSVAIDLITIVFMFLSSIHFGLIYIVVVQRTLKPLRNPVLGFYFVTLILISVVSGISLKLQTPDLSLGTAFLQSSFHVVSYASTTGFAIGDNSTWPMLPCFLLLVASMFCGCAGSTTGGLKIDRAVVLGKCVERHVRKIISPSSVTEIRFGNQILHEEDVYPHVLYIAMYFLVMGMSVIFCLMTGDPNGHAFTGTISSLGTVGPSLGSIGSLGNYNAEPVAMKLIFSLDMFLGRVEIFPVLAVFSVIFHRSRK